jgi:sugar phosphate isomerase/epimerase
METLSQSFKNTYLFKLGTTSFIYPDLYAENVRALAPYLDEIELLLFESREPGSLPDAWELDRLAELRQEEGVSYNIHMPTDVDAGSPDPAERDLAVKTYGRVIDLTRPLAPSTLTIHLPYDPNRDGGVDGWLADAKDSFGRLLDRGANARRISIETLDYSLDLIKPLIEDLDLSVCLDVGHVTLQGLDPLEVYETWKDRISIIHLHAVERGMDHQSLDRMPPADFVKIRTMLEDFTGTLSLEVFSFDKLKRSLDFFKATL